MFILKRSGDPLDILRRDKSFNILIIFHNKMIFKQINWTDIILQIYFSNPKLPDIEE